MREIEQDWQKPLRAITTGWRCAASRFYQTPKPRWESLHPIVGLADCSRVTGDDSYRQALVTGGAASIARTSTTPAASARMSQGGREPVPVRCD